jgi:hypothetical protein
MSKMDGLRAMREARYEEAAARARQGTAAPKRPAAATMRSTAPTPTLTEASEPAVPAGAAASTEGLCGHRAISGRTCTREHGHASKSHRYA